ncbi:hypothetical protein EG328_011266 [Venturia inaequalis]|uniref:Uncharacterized protein n=1 Tax=Venturia inaequalis TaxID=5025 RepID=A0A8H3V7X2_VENIN|nr:hypothetical protein EG328_011266 [Venturia inaequalis]
MQFYVLLLTSAIALTAATPVKPPVNLVEKDDHNRFQFPQLKLLWTCRDGDQCQCVGKDRIPYGESCTADRTCRKHLEDHKWCISPPFMTGRSIQSSNDHDSIQKELASRDAQREFVPPTLPGTCSKKHKPCRCVDRTGELRGPLNHCSKDSDCERIFSQTRCDSPPFFTARSMQAENEGEPVQKKSTDQNGQDDGFRRSVRRSAQDEYVHKPTQKEGAGYPVDASNPPAATVAEENKKPGPNPDLMRDAGTWPIPRQPFSD